jgi:hypothetical protein
MSYYNEINKFLKSIQSIDDNHCPVCSSHLNYDNQNDSIYVSCTNNLTHFEIAGFKSLYNGDLALLYNNGLKGIVDKTILKEFQSAIYRRIYKNSMK